MGIYVGQSKQEKEMDNTLVEDPEGCGGGSVAKRHLLGEQHRVKSHTMAEMEE